MVKASKPKVLLDKVLREDREVEHLVYRKGPSLLEVQERRRFLSESDESEKPGAPRSMDPTVEIDGIEYAVPDWLLIEGFRDEVLGTIKSGKEAEVLLVERTAGMGSHYLALKRYKDPKERAFRRDQIYREGRRMRKESREQKAVELGTNYGRKLIASQWSGAEFEYMRKLWAAGASVPFPVEFGSSLLMQFVGNEEYAAPRLVDARLTKAEAEHVLEELIRNLRLFSELGIVHADLSAFNVLVWEGEVFVIDFPQAIDLAHNPHGFDLLYRDVVNVCSYFKKWRIPIDPDAIFAECVAVAF
ncbi:MAG: RIO1 family regulatory kinase/ATPase [Acidimicrobiia bacterium]